MSEATGGKQRRETFHVDKAGNFSEWYNRIIREAELIDDRYNVKGFIVYRPWATTCLKLIYRAYEEALERRGHLPVMFPTVIPEENFTREAEHVEGFKPEVFWVTHGADEELEKRLALRPTSETAFYQMYALWIRSYTDLPLKLYQSCTVFRHETKATKPLLRGREFPWIEAHDAFATWDEAYKQVIEDGEVAEEVLHQQLGLPFLFFRRPQWDKFKGAVDTYAADCLMPDGKLNQFASTHMLGENFAKAFEIMYMATGGERRYVSQTCYGPGISRILAALISVHGDDDGLVFPLAVAPVQVVIVPIKGRQNENPRILQLAQDAANHLRQAGFRIELDLREETPGAKYYFWEMRGVPFRLEVGAKEATGGYLTLFRRDTRNRSRVQLQGLAERIVAEGVDMLEGLKKRAEQRLKSKLGEAQSLEELVEKLRESHGIVKAPFCSIEMDGAACAEKVRERTGAEVRGVLFPHEEKPNPDSRCIICGRTARHIVYVAEAY
ncbi:MAG: proline--tRNA ligase [Candidatus Bathyarchaeia archaeon]